jgi:hypothetical protein
MTTDAITDYVRTKFPDVDVVVASKDNNAPATAWGDTFFFYQPIDAKVDPHRFPFATIVTQDYAGFDESSNLNRPGVYRLHVGVGKETFTKLFGPAANTPHGVAGVFDFAALDQLLPHPVYGRMHWVSVLCPSEATFERVKPLLAEAHEIAVKRAAK